MAQDTGRHYLAIPGPSVMPDAVLQAMHQPAPNIYTGALLDLTRSLVPDLNKIARSSGHVAMYIANGHAMWEAALCNVLNRGDKVLCLATGRFGIGWGGVAKALGADVKMLSFGNKSAYDPEKVEGALLADKSYEIKAVLVTHVDTAVSVRNDIADLRALLDRLGHPALLMVDAVASLACEVFEMDAWGVDVMIAASQKGLMTPPGMGFIFFSEKARLVGAEADMRTPYWDWRGRAEPIELYQFFNGTAPTHHLFGLRCAVDMLLDEGIEAVWARHAKFARAYWAAFEAWGQGGALAMNISDESLRSHAVTALSLEAPQGTALRDWLSANAGVTLGIGLGMAAQGDPAAHGFFRVGHMGHMNVQMILGVIGAMDTGLKALGIAHGSGASEAAAKVLSAR
ncbi:MAG: alanine-glyoxylate transaminase/serine-glyoxylate transaminase/serine-pyruvate transaminase [Halocynthiibacter sp.]|jgi:alanine-glyoxylate transaminase/serine-glyoxylate transaminase/serine-pyruvate transaminase